MQPVQCAAKLLEVLNTVDYQTARTALQLTNVLLEHQIKIGLAVAVEECLCPAPVLPEESAEYLPALPVSAQ